jgi:DNA-binding transcriptional ArsR family regulator
MGTLVIVFAAEDMARTTIAATPHPMWELVFSMHRLQTKAGRLDHLGWHRQVWRDIQAAGLAPMLRSALLPLIPLSRYFPDFLTPDIGSGTVEEAIETVSATPRAQLSRELETMAGNGKTLPDWTVDLAAGRQEARRYLGESLQKYFDVAVRPHWPAIEQRVTAHGLVQHAGLVRNGMAAVLDRLSPSLQWRPPILRVLGYPQDRRLVLGGRGITMVPSYFCWGGAVAFADPDLKPILVYPATREDVGPVPADTSPYAVDALLGASRAAVLRASLLGTSTKELARRTETSPATVSHHTTILRNAGLLTSHRSGKVTLHLVTELGQRLLGDVPRPDSGPGAS